MFGILTGDVDQLPVLADCHRALGRHGETRSIWDELRAAGPDAPTMTEGRIVMSGSIASFIYASSGTKTIGGGGASVNSSAGNNVP